MKTVIFTRGESAEKQKEICEAYAREHDLDVLGYIDDRDELENYPDCQALLVSKRHRITRDVLAVMVIEFSLREKNIKLISADGDTGRSSLFESKFIEHIKRELNQE